MEFNGVYVNKRVAVPRKVNNVMNLEEEGPTQGFCKEQCSD